MSDEVNKVRHEDLRVDNPAMQLQAVGPEITGLVLVATYDDGSVHAINFVRDGDRRVTIEVSPDRPESEGLLPSALRVPRSGDGFHVRIKGASEAKFQ